MRRPVETRVIMLAPGELFGGVETQLLGLCKRLHGLCDHPPVLALFHDRELAARAREAGIRTEILPSRHRYDSGAARNLIDLVSSTGSTVLHVHGYRAMITAAVAGSGLGVPVVKTEHGLPEPGGGMVHRLKTRLNRRLDAWATRRAGAAVCYVTSDIMSRFSRPHRGLARQVVNNGIDPLDRSTTSRPAELSPECFNVGIVGRISAIKGIGYALQALSSDDVPDRVRLHVIGTGPMAAELERDAVAMGIDDRVRFHGFRRDVYDWLAHLDALVMPSLHEGLPYTLLEAMSFGTPVIASRVGGLAEVLRDEETGLLVDVGDVRGIVQSVARLSADPDLVSRLGRASAAEQREGYTLQSMTDAYLDVYASRLV